jgi:hypothetical protein
MRGSLRVPPEIVESIRKHITKAVRLAIDAHRSGQEEEDTLTGHLGAYLRTGPKPKRVLVTWDTVPRYWTWSLDYSKFRGRGGKAAEHLLGADGLFELVVNDAQVTQGTTTQVTERKTALFQAKKESRGKADLVAQCIKLSTWKEAAFVIDYSREDYTARTISDVLIGAGGQSEEGKISLPQFLIDRFVLCRIGDTELQYDMDNKILKWKDIDGIDVATAFRVKHRFGLHVNAPFGGHFTRYKLIKGDEVHGHRMEATDEEILEVGWSPSNADVKRAQRNLAKAYHSDRFQHLPAGERLILDMRMKEVNAAAERVRAKSRRPS